MNSTIFRHLFFALTLLVFIASPMAQADDAAEARQQYNEGKKALDEGRFREAALHFEATTRLRKHGAGPYAAAMAWEKAEQPARATDNFSLALELPGLDAKSKKEAQKHLDALRQSLGAVAVTGPEDLVVHLEDSTELSPPARLHGTPGSHVLIVVRGDITEKREVELTAGEVVDLDVTEPLPEPEPEPAAPPPPPPLIDEPEPEPVVHVDPSSPKTRKIIGYSAVGAGVVSAGVAVALGFKTLSARDTFEEQRTQQSYDDAKQLRLWTNVAWAGAVVLGGVGTTLLLWPEDKPRKTTEDSSFSLSATPTGVQLRGSF